MLELLSTQKKYSKENSAFSFNTNVLWELTNKFTILIENILKYIERYVIWESKKQKNLLQKEGKRVIQESLPCNDNTVTRNASDKPAYIEVLAGMQDSFGTQKQQVRSKPSFSFWLDYTANRRKVCYSPSLKPSQNLKLTGIKSWWRWLKTY